MAWFDAKITNFTTGEISPRAMALIDQSKYFNGCEILRNFLILTQGGASFRPGTQYIAAAKYPARRVRLLNFEFSTTQAYILELGHSYLRFFMNKGQIMAGPVPYEIAAPYQESQIAQVQKIQSADIMYLCHPAVHPQQLSRTGHAAWTIAEMVLVDGPYLPENTTDTTLTPSAATGTITLLATPSLGAEKITNGGFVPVLSSELVDEGAFALAGTWIYNAGWAHDAVNFEADHTPGSVNPLEQALSISAATAYRLVFTLKNATAGTITPGLGGVTGTVRSTNGTFTEDLITSTTDNLQFTPHTDFDGSIDDVSVKELLAESSWTYGAGWSHDVFNQTADHAPGSIEALEQGISAVAAKTYYLVFKVSNFVAGTVTPWIGAASGAAVSADGTFTQTITAVDTGNFKLIPSTDFDGSIDDVSVKEATSTADIFQVGHVGSFWRLKHGSTWGYVKITAYTSHILATAEVKTTLGGTTATKAWREGAFSTYRGFPRTLAFYEERLIFAGTAHKPQTLWGSKSADFTNFAPEDTITDAGPITYTIPSASGQVNIIAWLASMRNLMAGTSNDEISLSGGGNDEPLTPTNPPRIRGNTGKGSSSALPLTIDNAVLFVQRHGRKLRELAYNFAGDQYFAPDLTIWNEHITAPSITEMAFQKEPDQTVYAVRGDGKLAAMIYERAQEVVGWTLLETEGNFESVQTIPGQTQSEVWVAVRRVINGAEVRYLECFKDVDFGVQNQAFFVDCGLSYDPAPPAAATTISGLGHLEGKTVNVLADGAIHPQRTVSGGQITLDYPSNVVHVGLPYTGTLLTVRTEGGSESGTSQGKVKRVDSATIRVLNSQGGKIGPDAANLEEIVYREFPDLMDNPPPLFTGDIKLPLRGGYDMKGQIMIVQEAPLPLTVLGIFPRESVYD